MSINPNKPALDINGTCLVIGDLVYGIELPLPPEPYEIEQITGAWIKLQGINILFESEDFYLATTF